jgi:transcription factor SFP1
MEANFMKDFSCCGLTLPTLHELLQHYEEAHVWDKSDPNPLHHTQPQVSGPPDTRAAIAAAAVTNIQRQTQTDTKSSRPAPAAQTASTPQPSASHVGIPRSAQHHPHFGAGELPKMPLPPVQDMDSVDDMEMDDVPMMGIGSNLGSGYTSNNQPSNPYQPQERQQLLSRTQFGQPASVRVPPLDLNGLNFNNPLQGLRQSQPTTPVSGGRPGIIYHNNPTVSSVNTPTLSAHPLQQQFRQTPESSAPGTPGELDPEFIGTIGNMSMDNGQQFMPSQQQDYSVYGFGNGTANEMLDLCIDEPARRLYRANGALQNQAQIQARLGNNTVYTADSELAQRIREQQRKVGLADTVNGLNGEEAKPFRCPVIGCEKAYKNQNGLKYHKTVGDTPNPCKLIR